MAAGDVYETKWSWVSPDGFIAENVWAWQQQADVVGHGPFAIADTLANAVYDALNDTYYPCVGVDYLSVAISCRRVNGGGGPTFTKVLADGGLGDGASVSNSLGPNIALIPQAAPWRAGHIYLPGMPSSALIGDVFQAAFITLVEAFQSAIGAAVPVFSTTFVQVIYDRVTQLARSIIGTELRAKATPLGRRIRRKQ